MRVHEGQFVQSPMSQLQARHDEISRALNEAVSADQRSALKREIVALFRQAETAARTAAEFKDSVKQLAVKWKQGDADVPRRRSIGAGSNRLTHSPTHSPTHSTRIDHLGASTFIEKGWSKLSLWDFTGAEQALLRALELEPDDDESETLLGWALMLQEKYESAALILQKVLERNPQHAMARANIGYIALRKKNYGDAIEQLSGAVKIGGDARAVLYAHLYLGMVYREREMYDDAQSFFERALTMGPNLLQAWYELGRAHWFAGRKDAACDSWRRGADANKFNPWGKRCAESIRVVEQGGSPPKAG